MGAEVSTPIVERMIIYNYKKYQKFDIAFNDDITILVGANECGKSTIIEALNLCLKLQINNRSIASEISPFLFNNKVVKEYFAAIKSGRENVKPPFILIEVYFKNSECCAKYKGTNNSMKENKSGIKVSIELDSAFREEYGEYIKNGIESIPTEYYTIVRTSFAGNLIKYNELPLKPFTIANMENRFQNGVDRFITDILDDAMDDQNRAKMSVNYRALKNRFIESEDIKRVNEAIRAEKVSDKEVTISLDISTKSSFDSSLTLYVDDIPLKYCGKGEQTAIKSRLALNSKADMMNLIMIEEPESNQSFANMRELIASMIEACVGKQVIITTHSSYVINKYGLDKIIMIGTNSDGAPYSLKLSDLDDDVYKYFKKLPGYDTLRAILSKKIILVEGPSDELIVQKAYSVNHNGKLPLDEGVDVFTVNSLAFKRFLELLKNIGGIVHVVTDNDGDPYSNRIQELRKYETDKIHIYCCPDGTLKTLEPCFVRVNDLIMLNKIFNKSCKSEEELVKYMVDHKTEWALQIFDSDDDMKFPEYIVDAVKD